MKNSHLKFAEGRRRSSECCGSPMPAGSRTKNGNVDLDKLPPEPNSISA